MGRPATSPQGRKRFGAAVGSSCRPASAYGRARRPPPRQFRNQERVGSPALPSAAFLKIRPALPLTSGTAHPEGLQDFQQLVSLRPAQPWPPAVVAFDDPSTVQPEPGPVAAVPGGAGEGPGG